LKSLARISQSKKAVRHGPSAHSKRQTRSKTNSTSQDSPEEAQLCIVLVPDNKVIYAPRSVLSACAADDWYECIDGAAQGFDMTVPKLSERWDLAGTVEDNCFDGAVSYGEREALFFTAQATEEGSARAWKRTFTELNLKAPIERPAAPWIVVSAVPHGATHSAHVLTKLVSLPELIGWAWVDWVCAEAENTEMADQIDLLLNRISTGINIKIRVNIRL